MRQTDRAAEIEAVGIGKTFGDFTALEDISLTIGRGEFLSLLGPSGSGKTTFLMILAGFESASSGRLAMDGADITGVPAEARAFGMVFQGYALFPHMTVEENIAFPLKVQRRPGAEVRRRVAEMVELVGLAGHGRKRPSGLSGGQQQRVALARALAYEPRILLLDEPFSALDKNLRAQMQDEVRRLHRETGTTFVFVTHDQEEALALSGRIAIFDHGRLQQVGAPSEVYERPANRFVAEFLGDVNILPLAEVRPRGDGAEAVFEGRAIRTGPCPAANGAHLAVRPEHMRISIEPPEGNALQARIGTVTYLGAGTRLAATTPGGVPISLQLPTRELREGIVEGGTVWASWPEDQGFYL